VLVEPVSVLVNAHGSRGQYRAAECRDIRDGVRSAAGTSLVVPLAQDQHRCLTAHAFWCAVYESVDDEVGDHCYGLPVERGDDLEQTLGRRQRCGR